MLLIMYTSNLEHLCSFPLLMDATCWPFRIERVKPFTAALSRIQSAIKTLVPQKMLPQPGAHIYILQQNSVLLK